MKARVGRIIALVISVVVAVYAVKPMHVYALTGDDLLEYNKTIPVESNRIVNWPMGPVVGAESAILIEAETGTILYEKNIHAREYPASTTKILTCLIAAEECEFDEVVTFSKDAVYDTPRDSNNIAIDKGQSMTMEECLQAILIRSANECAFAVGEHIAGGHWSLFADIMNERAKELGCVDSNFVNPNGLPDANHYTSAYDLAMIGREFFKNEKLCEITRMTRLHIYPSANQPDEIIENSTNLMLEGKKYEYKYLVGAKTGYTDEARSCLVSCAEKDGMKLICVVMKDEAPNQYLDTISLFDYGFSNFEMITVADVETKYNIGSNSSFYSGVDIFGNSKSILYMSTNDRIVLPKTTTFETVTSSISYDGVAENEAALITYTYNGAVLGTVAIKFATPGQGYEFDEIPESMTGETEVEEKPEEERVVFINVLKIAVYVGVIGGSLFLIYWLLFGIGKYRKRHPNHRANWKRDRRRNKNKGLITDMHKEARAHRMHYVVEKSRRDRGRRRVSRRYSKFK